MASSYPVLQGKFGTTEYYLTAMPVGELISRVKLPSSLPDWNVKTVEEKFQRKLDLRRIKRDIAPYFANDKQRFSGSLILAVMNDDKMEFESLEKIGASDKIPKLYSNSMINMGFLIFNGRELLIPLDGQHRAKAFELAVRGYDDPNNKLEPIKSNPDLAKDEVAVILVRFDPTKSRYIFNKINRYAKPTKKADNLIIDDDDAMAVITRQLIGNNIIPERLVNIETNSLSKSASEFTTLATFYDCNMYLLSCSPIPNIGNPQKMDESERGSRLKEISNEWKHLISGIELWAKALKDSSERGDETRRKIRERSLLGRPIGQLAVIGGYAFACNQQRNNMNKDVLIKRLNQINWDMKEKIWLNVLVKPNGRIMSGRPVVRNAMKFIAHLIGANMTKEEKENLLDAIYGSKSKSLPPPIQ